MAENTNIAWADHTFNPWIGCTKVSPLCDHCYAEAWDKRANGGHWGPKAPRRKTKTWGDPLKWNKQAAASGRRATVFMASLADFFDNEADPAWRESAWALVLKCKSLDWLIVTKRIGNVEDMLPEWWTPERFPHVTLIASIGVQAEVLRDGPKLIRAKEELGFARVGISAEPLLERLDLSPLIFEPVCCERPVVSHPDDGPECCGSPKAGPTGKIDWVICGGESGPRRRPFEIEWAEELALQCAHGEVPFFFKQDSALKPGKRGRASKELWAKKEFPTFWTEPERDDPDPDYLREDREEARRLERW